MKTHELIDALLDTDGVESVEVKLRVEPVIRKNVVGTDDRFREIRERAVSNAKIKEIGSESWSYRGTVDVIGDYRVRDSFSKYEKYD